MRNIALCCGAFVESLRQSCVWALKLRTVVKFIPLQVFINNWFYTRSHHFFSTLNLVFLPPFSPILSPQSTPPTTRTKLKFLNYLVINRSRYET